MHRLILMRHAEAETAAPSGGDEARPLSATGRAEAEGMARALAERGLRPDLALVSGAVRTVLLCLVVPAVVTDGYGRGLHDKIAGTLILRTR